MGCEWGHYPKCCQPEEFDSHKPPLPELYHNVTKDKHNCADKVAEESEHHLPDDYIPISYKGQYNQWQNGVQWPNNGSSGKMAYNRSALIPLLKESNKAKITDGCDDDKKCD